MPRAAEKQPLTGGAPLLLDRKAAAALLGMKIRHFDRHVARSLPVVKTGRLVFFSRIDLEAWIDEQRAASCVETVPEPRSARHRARRREPLSPEIQAMASRQLARAQESVRRRAAQVASERVIQPQHRVKLRASTPQPEIPPELRLRSREPTRDKGPAGR